METFEILLGLAILTAIGIFFVAQHTKTYSERTNLQKVSTWVAIVGIALIILGL